MTGRESGPTFAVSAAGGCRRRVKPEAGAGQRETGTPRLRVKRTFPTRFLSLLRPVNGRFISAGAGLELPWGRVMACPHVAGAAPL